MSLLDIVTLKEGFCIKFSGPKTFFNHFVLNKLSSKAKQLRNVLGCILRLNIYIQNLSFSEESKKNLFTKTTMLTENKTASGLSLKSSSFVFICQLKVKVWSLNCQNCSIQLKQFNLVWFRLQNFFSEERKTFFLNLYCIEP